MNALGIGLFIEWYFHESSVVRSLSVRPSPWRHDHLSWCQHVRRSNNCPSALTSVDLRHLGNHARA